MATDVKRSVRLSARVAKEVAWALGRDARDPRVQGVTVTRVEMPDDLQRARVYVRLLSGGDDEAVRKQALTGLRRAAGMLRKTIAGRLGLRQARIEMLLEEVHAEERKGSR